MSRLIPARYYIEITRDAFVRGTGWESAWYVPLAIALLGGFFFQMAMRLLSTMQLAD